MFSSLSTGILDHPWDLQVPPDPQAADYSSVVDVSTFATYSQRQPTAGTSGRTLRRTDATSSKNVGCDKPKQPVQDVLVIGKTLENEAPYIPSILYGKSQWKKPKDRPKPGPISAVLPVINQPFAKSGTVPVSDSHLEEFLTDLANEGKRGAIAQQSRRALADIWANTSAFPKGFDNSEDLDRPRKRAKNVESESSQAGVNAPSALEAPNVHLLSLQEFWAKTTFLNRPSIHLAGPAVPPGLPISDRAFGALQAHTKSNHHSHVQLGADDLYVTFTFDKSPHFEFWDRRDNAYFLCTAQINLLATNPSPFRYTSLPLPRIEMIDIQCYTRGLDTALSGPPPEHIVSYTGARTRDDKNNNIPVDPVDGIAVEPEWFRVTRFGGARENNKRGWYLNIYVPIPAGLFMKKETRTFILRTAIWIGDEQEFPVEAAQEITVSHLRKEREML
ncbi:hypothetical protein BDZ94DRAFT_1322988 [Collybia nuda]|uniref:Uncharacterized protein n=1 Tax=Collybia nuda TaxID=64659 RepID=A0A9P5Y456_9AGAR|nr:hypothetical protein BDZ94DRAFT_1322988 [Collybia nuda]